MRGIKEQAGVALGSWRDEADTRWVRKKVTATATTTLR